MEVWYYIAIGLVLGLALGFGIYKLTRPKLPPGERPALPVPDEPTAQEKQDAAVERPSREDAAPPALPVEPVPPTPTPLEPAKPGPPLVKEGLFKKLVQGLSKTQGHLVERFDSVLRGRKSIDEELYEELETILLTADIGAKTTLRLLDNIRQRAKRAELQDPEVLRQYLKDEMLKILEPCASPEEVLTDTPHVIIVVGVNGAGKTTTIGKLASRYRDEGKSVLVGAGDTFRAAATEQLEVWAQRAGADVVKNKEGTDPSAVIFDAIKAGTARGKDVVIADTAGRLHTKANLMEELKKVQRVAAKAKPGGPHEVLLVLDATMGQNALTQARVFHEGCQLTGIVLTKLDGTAKGGVIIGICDELKLPVRAIGIGEKTEDLRPFDPREFIDALF